MKEIGLIGSHGYRAKYGGWDQLMIHLVNGIESVKFHVFNSKGHHWAGNVPNGHSLVNLPLPAHGLLGMFFDAVSLIYCWRRVDALLFLGNQMLPLALLLNTFSVKRRRLYINPGGFEWERTKYNIYVRSYLKFCMNLSARFGDRVVFDNQFFADQFSNDLKYEVIPYGAEIDRDFVDLNWLHELGLEEGNYFVSVSRSIEDNQIVELLDSWHADSRDLVLVSNLSSSIYGRNILANYSSAANVILIDGLYDKKKLDYLRRSSCGYIHTHKTCGSAPSLIEAIQCQIPIFSFDVPQNRYTLKNHGVYFTDFPDLHNLILGDAKIPKSVLEAELSYTWKVCIERYEKLFLDI